MQDLSTQYPTSQSDDLIDIQNLISIIARHIPLIIAIVSITTFAALIFTLQTTPLYTSGTKVLINNRESQVVDIQAVIADLSVDSASVDTEVEILRSRNLAERVAEDLNLFSNPEFNSTLAEPGLLGQIKNSIRGLFKLLKPEQLQSDILQEETNLILERENTVSTLLNRIQVSRARQTYVINILATSQNPRLARQIANNYAEQYLTAQLEAKYEATQRANTWLNERLESLREEVRLKEQAVAQYRAQEGLLDSEGSSLTEQQISDLNAQLILQRAELAEAQARFATVQDQISLGVSADSIAEALNSQVIRDLRSQYANATRRRSELATRYGPRHPQMITIERELSDLNAQLEQEVSRIVAGLESEVRVARQRVSSLQASLRELEGELVENNSSLIRLRELEREAAASRALFESFLNRFAQTNETGSLSDADARIIAQASLPTNPSSPRLSLNLAMGFMLGLIIAGSSVILLEIFDRGIRTENQIEQETGQAYLTSIPSVPVGLLGRLKGETSSPAQYLLDNPMSGFAEAYRTLRSAIKMSNLDTPVRTIAITSAIPGEGKTTTALCLSQIAALANENTLLIDCDIRRRRLSAEACEGEIKLGLLEVLSGQCTLEEAIVRHPKTGLFILPVVESKYTSHSVFESEAFSNLITKVNSQFNLVVLDTAPVLAVTDTRSLVQKVDGVVYTAKWGKTSPQLVRKGISALNTSHAKVLGIILNDVDMKAQQRYGYTTTGYYYRSYHKYYNE